MKTAILTYNLIIKRNNESVAWNNVTLIFINVFHYVNSRDAPSHWARGVTPRRNQTANRHSVKPLSNQRTVACEIELQVINALFESTSCCDRDSVAWQLTAALTALAPWQTWGGLASQLLLSMRSLRCGFWNTQTSRSLQRKRRRRKSQAEILDSAPHERSCFRKPA